MVSNSEWGYLAAPVVGAGHQGEGEHINWAIGQDL